MKANNLLIFIRNGEIEIHPKDNITIGEKQAQEIKHQLESLGLIVKVYNNPLCG